MNSFIVIKTEFSSAHLYEQKKWDEKKNRETFGACYTQYGHGHNYKWEITLADPPYRFLISRKMNHEAWVKYSQDIVHSIGSVLDHQHLNFTIPEFADEIPTTENISLYLKERLLKSEISPFVVSFRLYETEDLWTQIQIQNPAEIE